ncbi:glycosyltransferase family protein [Paenibacillus sp. N4]|uniref:cytidylyltransferase domain-containing protein n=1 Tax=Paenibacillus vietnamensis TaxID=2590547 RepID=UPI001CD0A538|nr:glycosyltransferase family protein [Paenibacillus vietnamensis]MCA0754950.1 glycosyltransferase family protein [Paenibacillus vietnamensis]
MRISAIIQARMGSTRLPGKVLKTVLGKPLLEYQLERVARSKLLNSIVVATTWNEIDTPIVDLCERLSMECYRGPEDDVLTRYYDCAVWCNADVIVRLTADCPIIDPVVIDRVIERFLECTDSCDYVSNTLINRYPHGMDTEVFTKAALYKAHNEAESESEREHVTPYFYQNPQRFRLTSVDYKDKANDFRWTVDTFEDFSLIKLLIEHLYPHRPLFTMEDLIDLHKANPEWIEINRDVLQKKLGE